MKAVIHPTSGAWNYVTGIRNGNSALSATKHYDSFFFAMRRYRKLQRIVQALEAQS